MFKQAMKRWLITVLTFAAGVVSGMLILANITISDYAAPYMHSSEQIRNIPKNNVGLILGTAKWVGTGRPNQYFQNRIDAAVDLFEAGKVKVLIVSGDNGTKYYNEPIEMKNELVKRGVPDSLIYLDYAGFRTLDSIVRCQKVFGQDRVTVVSQPFHNERAIYIGRKHGMEIIGYSAEDVSGSAGIRTKVREWFARVKVFMDLYVTDTQPRFLGEKIELKHI